MGDWKISILNQTKDGGSEPRTVNFMLFQTVPKLSLDSWSKAWQVSELGYPGTAGPIDLPAKTEFYVLYESHGVQEKAGPFNVKFGQQVEVTQKTEDAPPTVEITSEEASEGEIHVFNKPKNPKRLEFALYKNDKRMVSYKNVPPGEGVYLGIKPSIYIAVVEPGSEVVEKDFRSKVQSENATEFPLHPDHPTVNIGVFQKASSELYFKLL